MTTSTAEGDGGTGDDGNLSSHVFIAIISSVGAIILFLALMMIVAFICLCYNEYRKRRSGPQKNSDRVGLLRSRAEEEEIVSDQESEMVPKKSQLSGEGESPTARKRSPLLAGSNKVGPEPGCSTPPQPKVSKKEESERTFADTQFHGGSQDDVVCTRIDDDSENEGESWATVGEEAACELNTEVDDTGDTAQLVVSKESRGKRESMLEAWAMNLEAKAELLGRSVKFVESLSKSCPLDAKALAAQSASKTTAQYKSIPTNSAEIPDLPEAHKAKNRYRNVLPNPHSAVALKFTGAEGSTYINANFIRGLHGEASSYIAAQGPKFETMADFWRMVWEKDVSIIVMLTNLIENGRHKCVKYWPPANEKETISYGNIEVTRIEEERVPSCYLVTHLSVKNMVTGEKRAVYHFWCIAWPDFGIPKVAEPILKLRKAVDSHRATSPGPVVVHCSAGLGRSGTFIAIDMGIDQYQEASMVDPLKYLCEMRQDRGGMIQTQEQYAFVHQALAEYVNQLAP